jgi:hypothetical protein
MWAVGTAVTVTAIWRRNVDRVHPDGTRKHSLEEDIAGAAGAVQEAYARYRRNLLPLTPATAAKAQVAEQIWGHTAEAKTISETRIGGYETRVGFFDGGREAIQDPGVVGV